MQEEYTKIQRFFAACDGLLDGKYNYADEMIREILKSIAASRELTGLFAAVTERFDYPTAKQSYLRFPAEKGAAHGAAFLPAERGEVLAFVFCLLVEFDGGSIQLGDFLLRYFYEDGSFTASFALFTERMIRPFRDIVKNCFPPCGGRAEQEEFGRKKEDANQSFARKIAEERVRIAELPLREEDRAAAETVLAGLAAATESGHVPEIKALLCGYRYLLRYNAAEDAESDALFAFSDRL